jgi:cell division control protein 6
MLVKTWTPLLEDYLPPTVVNREAEQAIIRSFVRLAKEGNQSSLYIHGWVGVGKTVIVKSILTNLRDISYIYTKLTPVESVRRIVEKILDRPLPVYADPLARLKSELNTQLLVLDEVSPDNIKPLSVILHQISRETHTSTIIISRHPTLQQFIPPDTLSSLRLRTLYFPPYTKEILYEILIQRAELALTPNSYSPEILEKLSSKVAQTYGSARMALDVLAQMCAIASARGLERLDQQILEEAMEEVESEMVQNVISNLPRDAQILIKLLLDMRKSSGNLIPFNIAYQKWNSIIYNLDGELKSKWTFYNVIRMLKSEGLLSIISKGRGKGKGLTHYITLTLTQEYNL